ncbi:MAG: 3-oxoacyl-ACP reductase FabG [Prevotellaceae bacterium]|nr:3-oxoacyl-ACP reductase FabG [Prevotellaceae bacterium]
MKYALVTGGSRGIGRAVCIKLAQMGYNIIINYVSNTIEAEKTSQAVKQLGMDCEILMFDVSNGNQVREALSLWEKNHPNEYIEVLVNNAGVRRDDVLVFMSEDNWNDVLDVTLKGFYNVTQALLQQMMVHKYGRIVNMASVSGIKGLPGQTNYSAAKGGLIAATKALAQEVARKGVTVNAVAPGFVETDMLDGLDLEAIKKTIPSRRLGTPQEVAELVGFLASPIAGYITGDTISIDGGLYT